MRFLLKLEGLPADIELDDAKLTRLYRETKGIPGPLAQAILGAISGGNTMPMRGISNRSQRVFLGIVGILLLGGVIVYQDQINHLFQSPQSGEADKAAEAHSDQQITEPATDEPMQLDVALGWDSGDLPGQMRSMIEPADPLTGIDGLESMEDVQESQGLQGDDGANDTQNSPESEMVEISGNPLISTLPLEPKNAPESPEHTEIPKPDPIPEPVKASPSPAAIAVPQSPIDPLRREDWIKTRPAEHYTLQLLGVERLQALKDYVARYDLRSQAFYYITQRKGKPWHPLLWGDFPDKKSAIKGSKQLPLKVQNKGFWIRSFGELQAQLEKK
jgi:septal ring-binding cell division protein DamX